MAITNKDIEKLSEKFATKQDLEALFDRMFKTFATKQDLENYVTKNEFSEFRNEMLTHLDGIAGMLKNHEEEQTFMHDRIYNNHEPRITHLESIQNIAAV